MPGKQDNTGNFTVSITKANGTTFVIDNANIIRCYWIEDIYSYSMVGKLEIIDNEGLLEYAPFIGDEQITVHYGEITDYTYNFFVYKVETVEPFTDFNPYAQYIIKFTMVDKYFHRLHDRYHSKSYKDTLISDIIYDIMEFHVGNIDYHIWEDTNETLDYFYTGLKTPAENLRWLMQRATGSTTGQSGYMLFNSTWPEQWTCCTLEQLLQSKEYIEPKGDEYKYSFKSENEYYINNIIDYQLNQVDRNSLRHLAGGTCLGYDIKRKKLLKQTYTYQDALAKYTILGEKSLFPSNIEFVETPYRLETEVTEETIDNIYYGDWIKQYCLQQMMTIIVRGYEERHCGGMVEIEWPSTKKEWVFNKNLMGKWLVKSVTHQFSGHTKPPYIQKLGLIKNGYYDSDDTTLVNAINKNLSNQKGIVKKA